MLNAQLKVGTEGGELLYSRNQLVAGELSFKLQSSQSVK